MAALSGLGQGGTIKIDKNGRLLGRLFSIGFGIALVKALYDGGFHYYSMGYEKGITSGSSPIKFYLSICWYLIIFIVATYFGFIAKNNGK